jgi:hypothetical protein
MGLFGAVWSTLGPGVKLTASRACLPPVLTPLAACGAAGGPAAPEPPAAVPLPGVEVSTVDGFQGREKDVIVFVTANRQGRIGAWVLAGRLGPTSRMRRPPATHAPRHGHVCALLSARHPSLGVRMCDIIQARGMTDTCRVGCMVDEPRPSRLVQGWAGGC